MHTTPYRQSADNPPRGTGRKQGERSRWGSRREETAGMSTGYASPPSCRWATPRRDVDGFCLATTISMGYTSPVCRRAMPRNFHCDGLHLTGRSTGICLAASISWGFIIHVTGPSTGYDHGTACVWGLYARRVLCCLEASKK